MALEQTRYIEDAYLTDYLFLMDSLINTRKDVDFLCDKKILVNHLGDNNTATLMINNLNDAAKNDVDLLCDKFFFLFLTMVNGIDLVCVKFTNYVFSFFVIINCQCMPVSLKANHQ